MNRDPLANKFEIEKYVYQHKRNILLVTLSVGIFILGLMFFVWWSGRSTFEVSRGSM